MHNDVSACQADESIASSEINVPAPQRLQREHRGIDGAHDRQQPAPEVEEVYVGHDKEPEARSQEPVIGSAGCDRFYWLLTPGSWLLSSLLLFVLVILNLSAE